MKTVITYGTFDVFHFGHLLFLKRARALGDRLVVGVSTDQFNALKGKRSLFCYEYCSQIVASIRYVDDVFPENNWEQKREDILRLGASVLVMGDDWSGKFDFLSDLVEVVYIPRTPRISSSEIKSLIRVRDYKRL